MKICSDWALLHGTNLDTQATKYLDPLKPYTLLIPVTLKLVKKGATWKEIVEDQLSFLTKSDLETLNSLLETQPEKILFLFDGLDEYNEETSKDITDIMKRKKFYGAHRVITCRHEAERRTKDWKLSIQKFEIKGFSDESIKECIKNLFVESKEKGQELCKLIFPGQNHSSYLLPLARNPGNLCMICILHQEDREIGDSREQLFEEIVACRLSWWERRHKKPDYITPREDILKDYKEVLFKLGKMANFRDENQEMK